MNDLPPYGPPPSFAEAHNRRQKVRAAGLHPDYWYAIEYDRALKRGQPLDVEFWNRSIALFRDENNIVHAIENRCAHRQVKVALGEVKGWHLDSPYPGWTHGREGRVIQIPHNR